MISIPGKYYDGKSSLAVEAYLIGDSKGNIRVEQVTTGLGLVSAGPDRLRISPRLANTPRYLYFPEGGKFETLDNMAVDGLLKLFEHRSWLDRVHLLESRKRYCFIALAVLVFFMWGSVRYAVPLISETLAFRLPGKVLKYAGSQTLTFLDRSILKPSQLAKAEKERLLNHFQPLVDTHADRGLKIYFRKGGALGPNAFALPNGIIIFTDEMVRTAEHDDELLAVLAHEAGHVVYRHGMRTVIQDSLLGFVLLAMTGDVSGSSELFLGLPVLLTEMAYSRAFEHQADQYALDWLRERKIPTVHFVRLMERIEQKMKILFEDSEKKWVSYLSSHPGIKERIEPFLASHNLLDKKEDSTLKDPP